MKQLRSIAVGLAIAAAAIGISLGIRITPQMDTTWGAPDTTQAVPADGLPVDLPPITPLDTTWG